MAVPCSLLLQSFDDRPAKHGLETIDILDTSLTIPSHNQTDTVEHDGTDIYDSQRPLASNSTKHQPRIAHTTDQPELRTSLADPKPRANEEDAPQSVIHAPPGFRQFKFGTYDDSDSLINSVTASSPSDLAKITPSMVRDDELGKKHSASSISPSPLTTSIEPAKDWSERATPRAQTRQDFEDIDLQSQPSVLDGEISPPKQHTSRDSTFYEPSIFVHPNIPRVLQTEGVTDTVEGGSSTLEAAVRYLFDGEAEIKALKTALAECWTLCNTLAKLSHIHRGRTADYAGTGRMQENAWTSCWKLCQELYESQKDEYVSQVKLTLDLCREFCLTLFEIRTRDNELADSVLRVSFELNNHLYNTHDRHLPDAFRERTLDFYITLCHRLMKQRTRVSETDSLLKASWSLAEMLFTIRQGKREGRPINEEMLGSAVQACWELCDLFREGWTQRSLRYSDRGTPRPSQATFIHGMQQAGQPEIAAADEGLRRRGNPETPTTIFDETATISPDDAPVQNIFVLGKDADQSVHTRWSSNSSTVSEISQASGQTSSTNTIRTSLNDTTLACIQALLTKAAVDSGFQPEKSQSLASFVKTLSSDAFGSAPWQISLLKSYKSLLALDPAFRNIDFRPRSNAADIARAVQVTTQGSQYPWLRDLYRLVFGVHVDEVASRQGIALQA
ncbi:uncharacterized protein CDV56_100068 [Aspergillus thermomutatus]|uniref:DUF7624 domain-containing protein n=1 Tax=Aspergillus thermomutatus TaxID=41047 RepID=A0A397FYI0_ASPTH|nr:uncharacterized protein CDV56_100068 [Aspergillus thermomutatus]RHZ43822.1 hypothetical protein CDV56_100068 [Aspergillus thermomutatus]